MEFVSFNTAFLLVFIGATIGFIAGLLGIGGASILVPALLFIMTRIHLPLDEAIKITFSTTLIFGALTALSGGIVHIKKGAILWNALIPMTLMSMIGAVFGAKVAVFTSGYILKKIFAITLSFISVRMFFPGVKNVKGNPVLGLHYLLPSGLLIGFFSALIGIGGAAISVPIMALLLKFPIHKIVGVSTVMVFFTAISGIFGYIFFGMGKSSLPYSYGYVNLFAAFWLVITSIPMAWIGAHLTHKVNDTLLRKIIAIFLFAVGIEMFL